LYQTQLAKKNKEHSLFKKLKIKDMKPDIYLNILSYGWGYLRWFI